MAESVKLRFGIVGCGTIGPTHAGALRQIADADLVAVADTDIARAEEMARRFDVTSVYSSDRDLFADPEIDAVCLCTPSGMHADGAIAALEAGKHVVVEKPMDISLEACDRMIAAADRSGKKLTVISQHRFDAASRTVKEAIEAGLLGRIVLADASVKWYRTQAYYDSGDWRGTWAFDGGGALMNQGVHTVDLLQWLVGGVASLFAYTSIGAAHERIEVEDIAAATLRFENGAIGTITATTAAFDGFPVRIDIFGTEGTAILEGDRLKVLKRKDGSSFDSQEAAEHAVAVARGGSASVQHEAATRLAGGAEADQGAVWGDAHRAQLEDFIQAIRIDGTPLIDGRAGRRALEIILGVYRSSQTGQPITLH